jgi:hypothetical protein
MKGRDIAMQPQNRRRWYLLGALGSGALFAAGCASLTPEPIRISGDDIQQRLARSFPLDRRMLGLLDVHAEVPLLDLRNAGAGRMGLRLPVQVRERLSGQTFDVSLGFTALPLWDKTARCVRLTMVQVTDLTLARNQQPLALLERLGSVVAETALENLIIYQMTDDRVAWLERLGWHVASVRIADNALQVQLMQGAP